MSANRINTISFNIDIAPKAHDMGRNLLRGAGLTSLDSITDGGITLYRINSFSDSLVKIVEGVDGSKGVWVKTNTGETNVCRGVFFIAAVNKGETYTLSAWVKGTAGTTLYLEVLNSIGTARKNSDGTDSTCYTGTGSFATITDEWHRVTFSFTVDDLNGGYVECNFFTNAVGEFTICEPKLERGDVATAFCLNEADLKGDKGDPGKDGKDGKSARRTAVVNLTSDSGTVFNGSYQTMLRCRVMIDGKSMGGRIPRDNFSWTKDGEDNPKVTGSFAIRYRNVSSSDALDLWKCSVKIPKRLLEPIELTALRVEGNSLIFHASEDISKMTLYPCWKRHYKIRNLDNIKRNAWGFHDMAHDRLKYNPTPLPFTSLGDNNYSVDMSLLLSFVESYNIVLHKTAKVTTEKAALKHGTHTYWLKQGTDGKYHAWGRYGVWLADSNYTPISTVAKCKIYVETDSDTATTGSASLSV